MDADEVLFRRAVLICKSIMADEELDVEDEVVFKTCFPLVLDRISRTADADKSTTNDEGADRGTMAASKRDSDRETD